jgi:hypothetical protein
MALSQSVASECSRGLPCRGGRGLDAVGRLVLQKLIEAKRPSRNAGRYNSLSLG